MQRKDGTIVDRREMLRIKLKSLATEAKYIRSEEDKMAWCAGGTLRNELREHRTGIVRNESRATSLAYGFVKGYPRSKIESKRHEMPDWQDKELFKKVEAMAKKYGDGKSALLAQWWSGSL